MVSIESSIDTQKLVSENGDATSAYNHHTYYQSTDPSTSPGSTSASDSDLEKPTDPSTSPGGSSAGDPDPEKPTTSSASGKASFTPTQWRLLACLSLVTVLNGSLIAVMIPFFPVEAASRGVSQTVVSGVFSCFAVTKMMLSPVFGRLAPVIGVTRLYNYGLALAGLSTVAFGALNHIADRDAFMGAVLSARLIEAAGSAAIATCGFTIAGSAFGNCVTTAVAVIGSSMTIGLAFTPAIWGGLYAAGGFGAPFYTLGGIMLVTAAANSRLMPPVGLGDSARAPFWASLVAFAGSVDSWLCLGTVFVYAVDVATVDSSFAVYADQVLDVPPSLVGIFFLASITLYAFFNPLWARLSERSGGPLPQMGACLVASSIGIFLIAPSSIVPLPPHWLLTGLAMAEEQLFLGGAFTPCFKAMLDSSLSRGLEDSVATKAFVSSLFHTVFSLGVAVGPVSGGAIIDHYGFAEMTTVLGVMTALLGGVIAARVVLKRCTRRAA